MNECANVGWVRWFIDDDLRKVQGLWLLACWQWRTHSTYSPAQREARGSRTELSPARNSNRGGWVGAPGDTIADVRWVSLLTLVSQEAGSEGVLELIRWHSDAENDVGEAPFSL